MSRDDNEPSAAELSALAGELLGPVSAEWLGREEIAAEARARMAEGRDVRDAVLGVVHAHMSDDTELAEEFLNRLYAQLRIRGHGVIPRTTPLRNVMDTTDLASSVMSDTWPIIVGLEFLTERQFLALLTQRLRYKAADHHRKMRAQRRRGDRCVSVAPEDLAEQPEADVDSDPTEQAISAERRDHVGIALLRMSDRDRAVLSAFFARLDYADVAAALDLKPDAARVATRRALARLEQILGRIDGDGGATDSGTPQ